MTRTGQRVQGWCRPLIWLCIGLLWAGTARAEAGAQDGAGEAPGLAYTAEVTGVADPKLKSLLERSSQLLSLRDRPPRTRAGLRRRAEEDVERLARVMHAEGYYDAEITYQLEPAEPAKVTVQVTPNQRYRIVAYDIRYRPPPAPDADLPRTPTAVGIEIGMPARSEPIVEAERRLVRRLANIGRPFARVVDRRAVIDRTDQSMSVTLEVDPGPAATFGPLDVVGLERVKEDYVRRLARWMPGARYDQRQVDAVRRELQETRLFDSVVAEPAKQADAEGRVPVTVRVRERDRRTIALGLRYSSDEGAGAEASWEHRNLFGRQESLEAQIRAAQIEQEGSLRFRKPHLWDLDQHLLLNSDVTRETFDAYDKQAASGAILLERQESELWTVTGGFDVEYAQVEERGRRENFLLFGLPLTTRLDSTDDLLDPSEGQRLELGITPTLGTVTRNLEFVRGAAEASTYHELIGDKRLILAGRLRAVSVFGEPTEDLPAHRRVYAGGGGSVRGFKFQSLGPLDASENPFGGRSSLEGSIELRLRVTDEIGIVPFLDAGNVFDDSLPDLSEEPLVAAGIGLRYFTAVGPLRLDIAFPINRRRGVDDVFQFYISLGQAF